ncbi:hypothetical protein [Halobaculum sp. D14]|uniref:hypothetical protein n=1 Tax=Halobaculum sp. D14 TaxID=3421642 RepID=UPI003EBA5FC8
MAELPDAETWSVATFNVVGFALLAVLAGHAAGALTGALSGLGTLPGFAAFGYLWLLVVATTRWVFALGGLRRSTDGETLHLLGRGAVGGAVVGMGFAVAGAVVLAGLELLEGTGDVVVLAYLLLLGTAGGAVVGSVVGTAFGVVDVACYRAAALVAPETGRAAAPPADASESSSRGR